MLWENLKRTGIGTRWSVFCDLNPEDPLAERDLACSRLLLLVRFLGRISPPDGFFRRLASLTPDRRLGRMKHLLNGLAIAAAIVIAGPVLAQTGARMAPMSSAPTVTVPMPEPDETAAPTARRHHHRRPSRPHAARHGTSRSGAKASDHVANDLNAQELSRMGGGAPAPAPAATQGPPPPYSNQPGPRPSGHTHPY
jgi:hypothetical protein